MKRREGYELNANYNPKKVVFTFTSVGDKGSIEKIIEFYCFDNNLWNLGFGDVKGDDWEDNVISDNNDFRKVLQTVANSIHQFCDMYPYQDIQIVPLDYQRKLLYNRIFQQKWREIEPAFIVKGRLLSEKNPIFKDYEPSELVDEFLISRKN